MIKTVILLGLILAGADASRGSSSVTPVQKVLQLLEEMVAKGKRGKQEEQVQFAAYKQFCDDTSNEKKRAIADTNEMMEVLAADMQKYEVDAERLGHEIDDLDHDLAHIAAETKAATKARKQEHEDFLEDQQDYQESVDQIGLAIDTMKKEAHDVGQTELLQNVMKLPAVDDEQRKVIRAYLGASMDSEAEDAETLALAAPEAQAFEFHSQGIIDLFAKMQDKFSAKLADCQKEELEDKYAHKMYMADLEDQKETATRQREADKEAKAKALQDEADSKGSLADATAARDADAKFLADLEATCSQKAADFEDRQQLRAEEIGALEKAREVLGGGAVAGSAEKHLPSLVQGKTASFAQLRASVANNTNQVRVAAFLKDEATRIGSKVLSALSIRVAYDPYKSVKKMIKELIVKLMEEANEEAEHKGWCDTEMATNEQTRTEKTEAVELLNAEIDELESTVAQLTQEITTLTNAVAALDKATQEATNAREEEKAKNAQTVEDAQVAQEAVAQALMVLKEFYEKAATATSLVQSKEDEVSKSVKQAPAVFDEPYTGMQGTSTGVVGMIEVIQSDFARLEAETQASEAAGQREYEEFMHDSEVDKTMKSKDIQHKGAKRQNAEQALTEKKEDLEGTQKELNAALAYYEKLKPSCVDSGVSYEERVARRKEEIQSLQEALKILRGDDIAVFTQQ